MKNLAVAIPTFKRPELLSRSLNSLVEQCKEMNVEIYVYDDSCDDTNTSVYKKYKSAYANIHIVYNKKNLGIDKNIDQCISLSDADYIWVIGEDDLVADGAIKFIENLIKERSPKYLFANYRYISNDYSILLDIAVPDLLGGSTDAGSFFSQNGWASGFLGANVINKQYWDTECQEFMGSYFNHVGKIISKLKPEDIIETVAEPLVYNRAESLNSFSWLDSCFEVNAGFEKMIDKLIDSAPEWEESASAALVRFNEKIDFLNTKSLMVLRALGVYNLEKYKTYIRGRAWAPIYAVIAVLPMPMMKKFYEIYQVFRRRRHYTLPRNNISL
jgi:glycosyltransferase involved in cell wall biosynthesis